MKNHFDFYIDKGKDPYVQETTKIAEIRDNFGKLRFKVYLIDMFDYHTDTFYDVKYCITVESFCYGLQPQIILKEFKQHFNEAYAFYLKCIDEYKYLVIAETRHFQDIKIYADKIDYHMIEPDCCKNCKWSKHVHTRLCPRDEKFFMPQNDKLVCINHKIFEISHSIKIRDIEPIVSSYGICKYFCRNNKQS